ncbi:MAG TPA: glycyl-radical enzyme activating protein [Syntrophomonadaceae bacterium]|nr:glycyl-radical enzyme activating protein [Syntrophomonadaceae bacterium]
MTTTQLLILDIKGNSLDDGPGIRTVVFFKGCPIDCVWCHNPESKSNEVELSFDQTVCIGCDTCLEICHLDCLSRNNPYYIDRNTCDLCMECTETCPSGALSQVGKLMEIEDVVQLILKDKPFFETSNGGVTLSGGEPTFNMEKTSKLMQALKKEGIHILIETCGFFNLSKFKELIYPYADMIYYDIKIMDSVLHQQHCGVSNEIILNNFRELNRDYQRGGIKVLPRTPLIPGITDTIENIKGLVEFYHAEGVTKTELLSYNPLWHEKNLMIGMKNILSSDEKMTKFADVKQEQECRRIIFEAGIEG